MKKMGCLTSCFAQRAILISVSYLIAATSFVCTMVHAMSSEVQIQDDGLIFHTTMADVGLGQTDAFSVVIAEIHGFCTAADGFQPQISSTGKQIDADAVFIDPAVDHAEHRFFHFIRCGTDPLVSRRVQSSSF